MDLPNIFDDISIAELMAPTAELSYVQDAKFYVSETSNLRDNANTIESLDAYNCVDGSIRPPQPENLLTPYLNENVTSGNADVTGPCTMYSQYPAASQRPFGINKNESVSAMDAADEFLFDEINRNFEESKRENTPRIDYSDSQFPAENWFSTEPSPQANILHHETRDAFVEQIQEGYYPHTPGMIPSVVDQGAEVLAVAAAVKKEHQAQSCESENDSFIVCDNISNSSRRSNTGSGRRRGSKGPKPKLHQRTEPYSDAGMETKRKNAIKAHKNRLKAKEEKESMEAEISRLKALVQEKDVIIQRLHEERKREKEQRIMILRKELAELTKNVGGIGANRVL